MVFSGTQALAATDFGSGRPITAKDLSGKTVCWNDGIKETFEADGFQISSQSRRRRKWSVLESGLLLVGRRHTQIEVTSDGRFHIFIDFVESATELIWIGGERHAVDPASLDHWRPRATPQCGGRL